MCDVIREAIEGEVEGRRVALAYALQIGVADEDVSFLAGSVLSARIIQDAMGEPGGDDA